MNVIPPQVLLAPSVEVDPSVPAENYSTTVNVSVQTVFRESEAQTDPYTPEVTIDANKPTPEVIRYFQLNHVHLFVSFSHLLSFNCTAYSQKKKKLYFSIHLSLHLFYCPFHKRCSCWKE